MVPILNKTYYSFDDGKIRFSRRSEVVIKEIIPFDEIDQETLSMWKKEVSVCDWLFRETTDYFVKAKDNGETLIYVRTKNDGWFSLGFWGGGRLDIDGSLNRLCEEPTFISTSKFPDFKVKIGPKYTEKNPFTLYNTTTVYRVYDDNDEYDVSKIDTDGTIEWKVESIIYGTPHKNSSLYKNLIEYCKGL